MEQEMKICTKCGGKPKPIKEFEKGQGGKYTSRCKLCAAKYAKERKNIKKGKQNNNLLQNANIKNKPVFEELPRSSDKVQRIQMLAGVADQLIEIVCPCGIGVMVKLGYKYSFDSQNDYYEGECKSCDSSFKLTITTIEDK